MKSITASICLQVSVHTAYLAWIKLDEFRAIITRLCREPAASLRRRVAGNSGRRRHERRGARLIEQVPDQYLAWRDNAATASMSSAEFEPLSEHRSRITVFINYEANGALPAAREEVRLALLDFKSQAEQVARRQAMR
jgi:hypothetical protein